MEENKDDAYDTHLTDQINAAQKEQEETFIENTKRFGTNNSISVTEEAFEGSFFSEVVPWLKNLSLREVLKGCLHINSPQPLWVFFDTPGFVHCVECAKTIQLYRSLSNPEGRGGCDICDEDTELSWTFSSYQYFTIAGLVCQTCSGKQSTTLGDSSAD